MLGNLHFYSSILEYLLSAYYVSCSVLSTRIIDSREPNIPCVHEMYVLVRGDRQLTTKQENVEDVKW
jgi:hypothetical protein